MSVMPPSPLSYAGEVATPYILKPFAPSTSNNKFSVPTIWVDTNANDIYILARNEYIVGVRTAIWVKVGNDSGEIEGFVVNANTAPGSNPVLPISSGGIQVVTITGGQVAASTTANVIQTNSLAANTFTIQIQRSAAVASTTIGDNGVSHFNSAHFSVDANGFVGLLGGGQAVDSFSPDTGTDPVIPNGSGLINIKGQASPNISGVQITGGLNSLGISLFSPFAGDFEFLDNTVGGTRKVVVSQTNNSASSAAQLIVSVAGATADDPSLIWTTTVTNWSAGIDNSASDAWVLSRSTSLGSNNALSISTSNAVTFNSAYTFPTADGSANQVPTTNGSGVVTWQSNTATAGVAIQTFTANGTYTPTPGMAYCIVECVGGGGGGGGATGGTTAGGGGGGGAYVKGVYSAAAIGSSQTITIGAAATGGTGVNDGSNGADTLFGALINAGGGKGGVSNSGGGYGFAGAGGTGTGGSFQCTGSCGSLSFTSGATASAGQGGTSVFAGSPKQNVISSGTATGSAGTSYGAGGCGGVSSSGSDATGGAGFVGIIIVTEYL